MKKEQVKTHRRYRFKVKRTRQEPEITFSTSAEDSGEAINKLQSRLQMDITEMHSVEPLSVSKKITKEQGKVFTKKEVKQIKKDATLSKPVNINLAPFSYLNTGVLRTMISKLKRSANVKEEQ